MKQLLPINGAEAKERGWNEVDFVVVTGDAYVDHPSFGTAIISRVLEQEGFRVGVLAQPDWHGTKAFETFGRPRLGFFVGSGNVDSMVAHYTVAKHRRTKDAYSPGGKTGLRPDRAVIVYCNRIREAYGDVPIIIGGLEASLRRFAHYDYWSDSVRNSILLDSTADVLCYGMAERQTRQIARFFAEGGSIQELPAMAGTCVVVSQAPEGKEVRACPSAEQVKADKAAYATACRIQFAEQSPIGGKTVVQQHGKRFLVQYPPAMPLQTQELDAVYELPYARRWHPSYDALGGIPGYEEVQFSLVSNRGCFGACNFCALAFHQGRMVTVRSHESLIREALLLTKQPGFKGYIHDVGGPTANFRQASCEQQWEHGVCRNKRCLAPVPCKNLVVDHSDYVALLRKLRALPGVKKVFVRSGLRFDYLMLDPDPTFLRELVAHHISGQLKIAPEHCSKGVLQAMGKAPFDLYRRFCDRYEQENKRQGKKQYLVPYLMSSHPGSKLSDAVELALYIKEIGHDPQQVQDFYPTPGTISTCMYYTGLDPLTGKEIYVPKSPKEKGQQRALLQYRAAQNRGLVEEALRSAGRADLLEGGEKSLLGKQKKPLSVHDPRSKVRRKPRG